MQGIKILQECNKVNQEYCNTTSKISLLFFPGQVIAGVWMKEDIMLWIPWSRVQQNFLNVSCFFFLNACIYLFLKKLIEKLKFLVRYARNMSCFVQLQENRKEPFMLVLVVCFISVLMNSIYMIWEQTLYCCYQTPVRCSLPDALSCRCVKEIERPIFL